VSLKLNPASRPSTDQIGRTSVSSRSRGSDLSNFLFWALAVTLLAGLVQILARLAGWDIDVRNEGGTGRGILLALAVGGVFSVISAERRPAADYGLLIDDQWIKQFLGGFATAFTFYALYYFACASTGAVSIGSHADIRRWASAGLTSLLAFLIAPMQEIVFRGYLLTLGRNRLGTPAAVLAVSFTFAFCLQLHFTQSMLAPENRTLFFGVFLAGVLFSLMRLYHGSIITSTGVLSGWLFVEIFVRRSKLIAAVSDPALSFWLCPEKDPRRSPALWLIMVAAAGIYLFLLRRPRVARISAVTPVGMSFSFKKFFPFSSLSMLAPLDLWINQLIHARFAIGPVYVARLIAIVLFSAVNTVISLPERFLLPLVLQGRRVPDPVFIIGVHRSGTTHLHNLLALDPQFVAPKTYHVINPIGFLFSGWPFVCLLSLFTPRKRPMDAMDFSLFAPQEDEFAIAHTSRISPYWGISFPRQAHHYDQYMFPDRFTPRERIAWKKKHLHFLRKLCLFSSRRPLLKNPCNTSRIRLITELFPKARFVHIYRNPYAVYRSNIHLGRECFSLMQLQDPEEATSYPARFLDYYLPVEEAFYAQAAELPRDQVVEVRFEDLEKNPLSEIERMYCGLGMELNATYRRRLVRYLESIADYSKNQFKPLPEEQRLEVLRKLKPLFDRWQYDP
jgi:membrane protease YdiL (CAAX protease family)